MSDAPQSGPEPREVVSSLLLGNPRPGSRTALLAARVAASVGAVHPTVIDLATFGAAVLDADAPLTRQARQVLDESELVVVATPAYKGGYTGLLKVFADTIPNASLHTVAIPVVVAGSPAHAALVDLQLRLLLTELGVRLPTASVVVLESQLDDQTGVVDLWAQANLADLHAVLESRRAVIAA
jgi:FMN reductase